MKKIIIFTLLQLFLTSQSSFAYVLGDSNFFMHSYDDPKCYQPYKPYNLDDEYVRKRFFNEVEEYTECMKKYIGASKNDMERIQEQINKAVRDHNMFLDSL